MVRIGAQHIPPPPVPTLYDGTVTASCYPTPNYPHWSILSVSRCHWSTSCHHGYTAYTETKSKIYVGAVTIFIHIDGWVANEINCGFSHHIDEYSRLVHVKTDEIFSGPVSIDKTPFSSMVCGIDCVKGISNALIIHKLFLTHPSYLLYNITKRTSMSERFFLPLWVILLAKRQLRLRKRLRKDTLPPLVRLAGLRQSDFFLPF